jgi:hypothetical protein
VCPGTGGGEIGDPVCPVRTGDGVGGVVHLQISGVGGAGVGGIVEDSSHPRTIQTGSIDDTDDEALLSL